MQDTVDKMINPSFVDVVSPVVSFVLVVVVPICITCWVIYKTLTEKNNSQDLS